MRYLRFVDEPPILPVMRYPFRTQGSDGEHMMGGSGTANTGANRKAPGRPGAVRYLRSRIGLRVQLFAVGVCREGRVWYRYRVQDQVHTSPEEVGSGDGESAGYELRASLGWAPDRRRQLDPANIDHWLATDNLNCGPSTRPNEPGRMHNRTPVRDWVTAGVPGSGCYCYRHLPGRDSRFYPPGPAPGQCC